MGNSPSPLLNYKSNPHVQITNTNTLFVCWYRRCRCRLLSPPSFNTHFSVLFILLCGVSNFTFLVSSHSIPTNFTPIPISSPPPADFLNTTTANQEPKPNSPVSNLKLAFAISVPAFLLTLLVLMAFLKFFRFKIRRNRNQNRVSDRDIAVVANEVDYQSVNSLGKDACVGKFNWEEIQRATMNFSMSRVIGSGGFSTVYLAQMSDLSYRAVKIQCGSERLNQVYKQELQILLSLQHPNIVKLFGYCDDREEGVLVFEYVSNGTLQEKLHGAAKSFVLTWQRRMAIAYQLAEAIEYLHDKCSLHIVHGDIKSSNILLDDDLNCKLCDFGSAKMGFSSAVLPPSSSRISQMIMGSQGYLDPHYLKTGIASKKNDIYSFGVILLELLTGREAFCSETGDKLTSVAAPLLADTANVAEMMDLRLNGEFDLEEAKTMASISARCLTNSPSLRISASDILTTMRYKVGLVSFGRSFELSVSTKE